MSSLKKGVGIVFVLLMFLIPNSIAVDGDIDKYPYGDWNYRLWERNDNVDWINLYSKSVGAGMESSYGSDDLFRACYDHKDAGHCDYIQYRTRGDFFVFIPERIWDDGPGALKFQIQVDDQFWLHWRPDFNVDSYVTLYDDVSTGKSWAPFDSSTFYDKVNAWVQPVGWQLFKLEYLEQGGDDYLTVNMISPTGMASEIPNPAYYFPAIHYAGPDYQPPGGYEGGKYDKFRDIIHLDEGSYPGDCEDGIDNDGSWNPTEHDIGADWIKGSDPTEYDNGEDNNLPDGFEKEVDCGDPGCFGQLLLDGTHCAYNAPENTIEACNDGIDNDDDGDTDFADSDCIIDSVCPIYLAETFSDGSSVTGSDGCCGDDYTGGMISIEDDNTYQEYLVGEPECGPFESCYSSKMYTFGVSYSNEGEKRYAYPNWQYGGVIPAGNYTFSFNYYHQWDLYFGLINEPIGGIVYANYVDNDVSIFFERAPDSYDGFNYDDWNNSWEKQFEATKPFTIHFQGPSKVAGLADDYDLGYFANVSLVDDSGRVIPPTTTGDLGYINSDKQYFCSKDFKGTLTTPEITYNLELGNWTWWNAEESSNVYRVHTVENTDLISNSEEWNYCDPFSNNNFEGTPVDLYDTFIQGEGYGVESVCSIFFDELIPIEQCNGEDITTNCCFCASAESCAEVENPDQCLCVDDLGDLIINATDVTVTHGQSDKETSETLDTTKDIIPNFDRTINCEDNTDTITKRCAEETVCESAGSFIIGKAQDSDPANGEYCCISTEAEDTIISCKSPEEVTCEGRGGTLCGTDFACADGHILDSSEDSRVCCDNYKYCYDPEQQFDTATTDVSAAFLCYAEGDSGVFGECCNKRNCFNKDNQDAPYYPYDWTVFGTGTPLHSITSYEKTVSDVLITYVSESTGGKIGTQDISNFNKQDWTGYDNLEFDFYYSTVITSTPIVIFKDGSDTIQTFNLTDYSVNGENAGKWLKIIVPLSDLTEVDTSNMKSVSVDDVGVMYRLDNFHLTIDSNDKTDPRATWYCAGNFRQWVSDVEPSTAEIFKVSQGDRKEYAKYSNSNEWGPYKEVCDYNKYGWTGSRCCGDDQSKTVSEYYEDAYGGCWDGDEIYSNERLQERARKNGTSNILYYDEHFQECMGNTSIEGFDGEANVTINTIQNPMGTKLGGWICSLQGIWTKDGEDLTRTSRVFVAAKMYNISEKDFTLSCGNPEIVSNTNDTLNSDFICILNNAPNDPDSKEVFIGLTYGSPTDLIDDLKLYVPFTSSSADPLTYNDLELDQTYLEACSNLDDSENFTKCPALNGSENFYAYHNAVQKAFIFGFKSIDNFEKETVFEIIWNAIANFFRTIFTTEAKFFSETDGIIQFLDDQEEYSSEYDNFYIARGGYNHDKSIIGSFEGADYPNKMTVKYYNFATLNLTTFVDQVDSLPGVGVTKKDYVFACNSSILHMANIKTSEKYWNFFTTNIRISNQESSGEPIGDCTAFCGDGAKNSGEDCDFNDPNSEVSCNDINSSYEKLGQASCNQDCAYDITSCVMMNESEPVTDEPCTNITFYQDLDNDTYGTNYSIVINCTEPEGYADRAGDCNDFDATVNPGVGEIADDGIDNDCNGFEFNDEEIVPSNYTDSKLVCTPSGFRCPSVKEPPCCGGICTGLGVNRICAFPVAAD